MIKIELKLKIYYKIELSQQIFDSDECGELYLDKIYKFLRVYLNRNQII